MSKLLTSQQPVPPSFSGGQYFTETRAIELAKVAALCGSSALSLATVGSLSAAVPPVAVVLTASVALGFAGCIAFSVVTLAAPNDEALNTASQASVFVGPGVLIVPVGVLLDGERGARIAAGIGNLSVGAFGLSQMIKADGASVLLSAHPDKALFMSELVSFADNFPVPRPIDYERSHSPQEHETFDPSNRYDLDTTQPPGMGDVGNNPGEMDA